MNKRISEGYYVVVLHPHYFPSRRILGIISWDVRLLRQNNGLSECGKDNVLLERCIKTAEYTTYVQ